MSKNRDPSFMNPNLLFDEVKRLVGSPVTSLLSYVSKPVAIKYW